MTNPMIDITIFQPIETKSINVSATSASVSFTGSTFEQVRIYNAGTKDAFIRWGNGAQTAVTTDLPVPAGAVEIFQKGDAGTIAAITASGTTTLYVTSGRGL